MVLDERTRTNLDEIIRTVEKRKETFGKAFVGFAFSRDSKKELKLSFGIVNFQSKDEAVVEATTYDYGEFILTKKSLDIKDALDLIKSIFENQMLKFSGWPDIPVKVYLSDIRSVESRSRYGYIISEWPMVWANCRMDDSTRGNIPSESLSRLGLPLFPNGVEAIDFFFNLHLRSDWHTLEREIEFIVPDHRARIRNLRLAGNKATVEVETKEIAPENVLVKFYCKGEKKTSISEELHIDEGRASFTADEEPFEIEAHIMSKIDGNSIDKKKFDYRYPSREEGIIIEGVQAQLLDVIDKGENVNVEFKRELDKDEFLETVVAFANTEGGTIFLGVDDNGQVKGFREEVKDKITDLIADHCDPPIEVQVDSDVLLKGIPITLVTIEEGENRPYVLKDRGIFVRRGASDRQIKRTELDDIYSRRQQYLTYH